MKQLLDEYKTLKDQKQFLKMIYANIVNRFGDSIDAIAFTWLVYELTGSAAWSTIIFGVNMVPGILIQPFAGALVEKMSKKKVMVICDFARAVFVSIVAFCYASGVLTPWLLLLTTILNSSVESLRVPAGTAIVPHLLAAEKYDKGIALNSSLSRMMELVGTACAGIIIASIGISGAILIDAITFALSALIISTIRCKEQLLQVKISLSSYLKTLKEGFMYIKSKNIIIVLCVIAAFLNFMLVPINSFLPAYVQSVLKGGSETLSLLSIGITLGSIFGSLLYPIITKYITKRRLLLITTLYVGIFLISSIALPNYISNLFVMQAFIFVLYLGLGFWAAAASTFASVLLTSSVDHSYLARVGAVFGAFATLMIPLGSLLTTFLLQFYSFIEITIFFGIASIILFVIYRFMKSFYLLDK